jgi:Flp pilus assembly pilin Flp
MNIPRVIRVFGDEEAGITSAECALFLALGGVVVLSATALLGGRLSAFTSDVAGGISESPAGGGSAGGASVERWKWMF